MNWIKELLVRYLFCSLLVLIFCVSCNSEVQTQKELKEKQEHLDSIALIYDDKNVDPRIDQFMNDLHRKSGFNGNVLIAKKGKIIYQNSFGWADYLMRDSLKLDSKFELASVSKPLTAIAALQLIEKGKLSLDAPVDSLFVGFPFPGVTVRHLLTHRSGLPNYIYFVDRIWENKRQGMSNLDAINLMIEGKPNREGKPDGRFHYNNSNYMLLGAIVEKISGQDFDAYLQENIFVPAGMKNSASLSTVKFDKIPTNVVGHDKVWRRSVRQDYLDGPVGDKGIYSTVQDLFLLDRALKDGRLLDTALLDSAYVPRSDAKRGLFSYGYGWRTFTSDHAKVVYHTGWWHGFKSLFVRDLTNDITIVLLSNMANGSLSHLDNLYKMLEMPILRQGAYGISGETLE